MAGRSRGRGGPSGREDGAQRVGTVMLVGYGADVAPDLGTVLEGG
jgi:hypothetical protein